ncbi:Diamine acetyltransferase 2 [Holothuria leucospilota]|uniref:Diamine acetyltransferase 2 n=1 Tax=Holothuria leucospilota TaxID=206669 RepID=A0A9Q1H362_HOLLE|nr:Diamine acetyltransferase 2 [Holothuria leucospilota]
MCDYSIRNARVEDASDILRLAKDLAHHDHVPPEIMTATEQDIARDMSDWFHSIVLEHEAAGSATKEIVGFALWSYGYIPVVGRNLNLASLYVCPHHRGRGLGYSLIQSVAKIGYNKGCLRIRLLANESNKKAHEFYTRIKFTNSTRTEGWELLHIYGPDFENLALQQPKIPQDF